MGTRLLGSRRFWPLFATQFLGAFNDNLFKNALVVLITFGAGEVAGLNTSQLVALCGGLFILPFFLFSPLAGQMADRFSKSAMIPWVKAAEAGIMALAAAGFVLESVPLLLAVLFLMGAQSAFFGPLKFGILPELLDEKELVGGNALVELGTFLAILLGTIVGGRLMSLEQGSALAVGGAVVAVAALGIGASLFLRRLPAEAPELRVRLNPIPPAVEMGRLLWRNRTIRLSALGVAWFWFYSAGLISVLPTLCRDTLGGNAHLFTLFLALFAVGIGAGSMLCERLSWRRVELGLVPLGSLGMTLFTLDLYWCTHGGAAAVDQSPTAFLADPGNWRVVFDLVLLAITAGLYIVPLQTLIQQRSPARERARIIAASNMLSSLFMVLVAVLLVAVQTFDLTPPTLMAAAALLNLGVAAYIYTVVPEFLYRFIAWLVTLLMYRIRVTGAERIPREGPAVLVCNHVSFVDWLLVSSACARPARFVMYHKFARIPVARHIVRRGKVIPIAPLTESRELLVKSFDLIAEALEEGEVVCIFPEGAITRDGKLGSFQRGIEKILKRTPVPVVPMAIQGMWGSFFSRSQGGRAFHGPLRPWQRVEIRAGEALPAEEATADRLRDEVAALLADDEEV